MVRNRKLLVYISNYIFRALEWWYLHVLQRMSLYTFTGIVRRKGDSFAFKNNPSIDLLSFISAFFKQLPFSKHFIQLNVCKTDIWFLFPKHLVGGCFVGTHVVKLRSCANLCCDFFFSFLGAIPQVQTRPSVC